MRWRRALIVFFIINFVSFVALYSEMTRHVSSRKSHPDKSVGNFTQNFTTPPPNSVIEGTVRVWKEVRPNISFVFQPISKVDSVCENTCIKSKPVRWLMTFFVKSSAENSVRRELIRRTWSRIRYMSGAVFNTIFVLGKPKVKRLQNIVVEEQHRYKDILQYNGPDNYKYIATKTLAAMQWASYNLPKESLYSSVDDDFLLNIANLQETVDDHFTKGSENGWPEFPIICGFVKGVNEKPVREKDAKEYQKWVVSQDLYKWTEYPPYCHGGLYTTSVQIIKQLFELSIFEKPLHLDDVWLTGILRQKLGMPDSMVVKPGKQIGYHFNGFSGKRRDTAKDFMKKEWDLISKDFISNSTCCLCN